MEIKHTHTVTHEYVDAILLKKHQATLRDEEIVQLLACTQTGDDADLRYKATKVLKYQMRRGRRETYRVFQECIIKIFAHHSKAYLNVLRNILKDLDNPVIRYVRLDGYQQEVFTLTDQQLPISTEMFVRSFANYIQTSDAVLVSWLHQYFWKPYEVDWIRILRKKKSLRTQITAAWFKVVTDDSFSNTHKRVATAALQLCMRQSGWFEKRRVTRELQAYNTFQENMFTT